MSGWPVPFRVPLYFSWTSFSSHELHVTAQLFISVLYKAYCSFAFYSYAFMLMKQWLQLVVIQDACLPSGATWGSPSRSRTHSDRQLENVIFFYMCEEDCPFLFLTVSKTLKILYFDCKDVLCLPHLFLRIFRGDVSPRQTRKLRGEKTTHIWKHKSNTRENELTTQGV